VRIPLPGTGADPASSAYHVQGGALSAVVLGGDSPRLRRLVLDGKTLITELPMAAMATAPAGPGGQVRNPIARPAAELRGAGAGQQARSRDEPLELHAGHLSLEQQEDDQGTILITGRPAIVRGRGVDLRGDNIQADTRANRLWINGPGTMRLPLSRQLQGASLPADSRVRISWNGGLQFDGQTVAYADDVLVETPAQQMRTGMLRAYLTRRVDLSRPPPEPGQLAVAVLEAIEGVQLHHRGVGPQGELESVLRVGARDLWLNQQSGELRAAGPGWIAATFSGQSASPVAANPLAAAQARQAPRGDASQGLSYVHVAFEDRLDGNLHRRQVRLRDRVQAIHGPVATWNELLDPEAPIGRDSTRLLCDELTLMQFAPQPMPGGSLELHARGNTSVTGAAFSARGHQLKYNQGKDMLILEGDGRQPAEVMVRRDGSPLSRHTAQRIVYWRSLQRVDVDGGHYLDFGQPHRAAAWRP
jgi:hypothetical protein